MSIKVIKILEVISGSKEGLGVSDICRKTDLSTATAHRLLTELVNDNYLFKDNRTKKYSCGYKLLLLSNEILKSFDFQDIIRPQLMKLVEQTQETVHLVFLEGNKGVFVDKIDTPNSVGLLSKVGKRFSLYSTCTGKAMLAYFQPKDLERYFQETVLEKKTAFTITDSNLLINELQQIRERGYSVDNQENREGSIAVGAPLFDFEGKVYGAISVAGPAYRFSLEKANEFGPKVKEIAHFISQKFSLKP